MAGIPGPFNCSSVVLGLLVRCPLKIQETLFHLMTKLDVLQIVPAYDTLLDFPQFRFLVFSEVIEKDKSVSSHKLKSVRKNREL